MTPETKQKIVQWIFDNHEHHEGSSRAVYDMETQTSETYQLENECPDGDYPYVNSMKLEEFIKSL